MRRFLGLAGIIGPLVFIAVVIAQGILHPDYSHIAMPVSALAAWPAGWVQNVNFFMLAAFNAMFTVGLHSTLQPTRFGFIGIGLLLASSVGLLLAGLFPWIRVNGVLTETPQHIVGAITTFLAASTGLIVLSRRIAADASWRDLSRYVLSSGVVMLVLFIVVGFFAVDPGTPFHSYAGLLQRLLVALWIACQLTMARRIMRGHGNWDVKTT